jgi:hypothetical protein
MGRDKLIAEIRKRPFRPEDFAPNPPANSDPFRNNLKLFVIKKETTEGAGPLVPVLARDNTLEELKLAAIVVDPRYGAMARAMFIDSKGMGIVVKRGDRLSKSAALVQRILSDRVLFEFVEEFGQGPGAPKKRTVVRPVELHPTESQQGAGSALPTAPAAGTPR